MATKWRNSVTWKTVVNICRFIPGIVFVFSGFVKAVDPLGTSYKIQDYLTTFGLLQLTPDIVPLALSVALAVLEFGIGIHLLLGIKRRATTRLALLVMLVMTPLTLYLALTNPISDCGCFGDALVLTNWQTFGKNVVLLICVIVVFLTPWNMVRFLTKKMEWTLSMYSVLFALILAGYCLMILPVFDFRPYKIGNNIRQGMEIPEGAKPTVFDTRFVMEKEGVKQTFKVDDYPDSTWTFVSAETVVLEKGYEPPIHDFVIEKMETGEDITDDVLDDPNYTFLLVMHRTEEAEEGYIDLINELFDYSVENGYRFYALSSSSAEAIEQWRDRTGAEYPFCIMDDITLKTMIRSNPGLMLIKEGVILNKWCDSQIPDEFELTDRLEKLPLGQVKEVNDLKTLGWICVWFMVPLALIVLIDRIFNRYNNKKTRKSMRKKIVAGNWKMNMNLQDGVALAKELNEALTADKPNCGVVICTPFIHLATVAQFLNQDIIGLGAENCADKAKGAYTGEVSAEMVKSTGAQYVILGHSERREYYKETPEILKEKVLLALANGLKVIFCIGESLEEREANKQNEVVKAELEGSVFNLSAEDFAKIIIAYEPIWAIGTGKTATAEQAEEIHAYIRSCVADKYGAEVADDTTILYGGSCKASNAPELFAKPDIDGGLIGGASLKCADFKGIIDAWK
ncbi:MAG: triose-phosphate isomerase [Bacteroidaceae bacterium]|nr:triose-phosphate isomerase [Bacteroidaceae bacterium]